MRYRIFQEKNTKNEAEDNPKTPQVLVCLHWWGPPSFARSIAHFLQLHSWRAVTIFFLSSSGA